MPTRSSRDRSGPRGVARQATAHSPTIGGRSAIPSTWHCIVTTSPTAATSHQRARPVVRARQAPASATALDRAIRFGFQMNVDSSIALAETAIMSAATNAATGPAIERASHQVTATAAVPASAISATTAVGFASDTNAAGASR